MSKCVGIDGMVVLSFSFFFQAEDGIRDLVRSRGLGDVYKRQIWKGAISFGLITIPIKVYGATETKDLSFRQVHPLSLIHI